MGAGMLGSQVTEPHPCSDQTFKFLTTPGPEAPMFWTLCPPHLKHPAHATEYKFFTIPWPEAPMFWNS